MIWRQPGQRTHRPSVRTVFSGSLTISLSSRLNQLILRAFRVLHPLYGSVADDGACKPDSFWTDIGIQFKTMSTSTHANTQEKTDRFDIDVKKFRSICDMHGVGFGSPEDFSCFMQKLAEDRRYAMDFWAVTGTLSSREGGQLSDEQMLAIIVRGVAGLDLPDIPDADSNLKKLVGDLASLLAGVDLHSPTGQGGVAAGVLPPVFPPTPADSPVGSADGLRRDASVIGVGPGETGKPSSPFATVKHQLDEALLRLELNSLELKAHINNLDNKMSRIEPHLEEITSMVSSSKEQVRSPVDEPIHKPVYKPIQESVRRPAQNSRLVLEPNVDDDDPSIPIPLEGYSQRGGGRSVVYFVVFLLLVAGGIFAQQRYGYGSSLWQRYGPTLRERYSLLVQQLHGADAGQVAVNATNHNPPQNAVAGSGPVEAPPSDGGQSANPPVVPSASTPPPSNAESSSTSEHVVTPASVEPLAADARSRKPHSRRQMMMLNRAAAAEAAAAAAEEASSAGGEAPINVAPAVMEANLVLSRVPAYPEVAKAERIEGPVVVQAVISKDGTVDRVHVIEGDRLLRDAASEAVRRWRYKPYLLNGKPVEVATTVTVDFKLDR